MFEVTLVAGARPNFMKIAPMLRALRNTPFVPLLVHTGQHYDAGMSDIFFRQLGIPNPDVSLGVGSGRHGQQTARVLESFEEYLLSRPQFPKGVIVVGDVNSTVACSLAACKLGIPVAHIEAGLRSFDRTMPEEINRIITDAISDLLFVSEPSGEDNLRREGISEDKIIYVGNVMIDTLLAQLPAVERVDIRDRFGLEPSSYAVVTLHRPSNVDDAERLTALIDFLLYASERVRIVFAVHPRTRERLSSSGLINKLDNRITLSEPLGYIENLALMRQAKLVLTDSGGMQEETTFLGIPCLTMRANTERPVTVSHGTNTIVGEHITRVYEIFNQVLTEPKRRHTNIPGWDGEASQRIAATLCKRWLD
ncbi:MAG TPA: UDP-N-acetylglucosamine 2-epimerase (non-hydrolyzing) [Bryobacteraceae bacterium]|nr:UDP-N-acetylglucosamine 2-epimerase (non-hydrolyzing) [Bryobacteraceae bacterium]